MSWYENNMQTLKKAGITGLATLGTYLATGALEDAVTNPVLSNALDTVQTAATMTVPYVMANKYMNRVGDSDLIKYITKAAPLVLLGPELLGDIGETLNLGAGYSGFVEGVKNYVRLAGLVIPAIEPAKEVLEEGYYDY